MEIKNMLDNSKLPEGLSVPDLSSLKIKLNEFTIDDVIEKLNNEEYFSFVRLFHMFWEVLFARVYLKNKDHINCYSDLKKELQKPQYSETIKTDFFLDIFEMARNAPDHIKWAVWPGAFYKIEGSKPWALHVCIKMINLAFEGCNHIYDGMLWKDAAILGRLDDFVNAIKKYKVVIVGLKSINRITKYIPIKCEFIPIEWMSYNERNRPVVPKEEVKEKLEEYHEYLKGEPVVYLTQMATAGTWIIGKMNLKNAFVFDMGLALNCWSPRYTLDWHNFVVRPKIIEPLYL